MKKARFLASLGLLSFLAIPSHTFAFIPLICDLCTVGVVAGLGITRYFGIDDTVSGVWIGAVLIVLISGINTYCEKKKWNFRFREALIAISTLGFSYFSFYMAGLIRPGNVLFRNTLYDLPYTWADKILVSSVTGALVLIGASSLYQWMKKKNGKPHFPFERVVLPIVALTLTSIGFFFITR